MNNPQPKPKEALTVVRLDSDAIAALERELARPVCTNQTTAVEAGYLLGIQAALKALRNGYVVP